MQIVLDSVVHWVGNLLFLLILLFVTLVVPLFVIGFVCGRGVRVCRMVRGTVSEMVNVRKSEIEIVCVSLYYY